jgi:hypothetical protein
MVIDIPIHPELSRALEAVPKTNLTFPITERSAPFSIDPLTRHQSNQRFGRDFGATDLPEHGREGVDWSHCLPDLGQDRRAISGAVVVGRLHSRRSKPCSNSGRFATFAAIRRATSFVSSLAADRPQNRHRRAPDRSRPVRRQLDDLT